MNDEKTIRFAYIAGREHDAVSITKQQYEKIKNILYVNETKETEDIKAESKDKDKAVRRDCA